MYGIINNQVWLTNCKTISRENKLKEKIQIMPRSVTIIKMRKLKYGMILSDTV